VARDLGRRLPARHGRVEEPRAVQVQPEIELAARLGHCLHLGERPDASPCGVVRVLDRDDPSRRHVAEVALACRGAHLIRGEAAVPGRDRPGHEPRVHRRPAELGDEDVRQLLGDQLVAGLAEHAKRDLVRHRRRRNEDGVLVAEEIGRAPLELVDGRILADLLVAHFGVRDCLPHGFGRLRRRIGAEVDHPQLLAVVGYRSVSTSR
jgi:hypothetical protein